MPPNHPFYFQIFHFKPSSYWGTPNDYGTPILIDYLVALTLIYLPSSASLMPPVASKSSPGSSSMGDTDLNWRHGNISCGFHHVESYLYPPAEQLHEPAAIPLPCEKKGVGGTRALAIYSIYIYIYIYSYINVTSTSSQISAVPPYQSASAIAGRQKEVPATWFQHD